MIMRSQTSERATTSLRYLMVACMQVLVRKFRERLTRARASLIQLFLIMMLMCPLSFVPRTPPISTPTASVEARYLHLHPPLLASKAVLSS